MDETHLDCGFLLMHNVFLKFTPLSQGCGVNTGITLDAAKWNCDGAELSSCVITLFYWIMYYNILNTFGTNLPVDFYPFVLCTYIYVYVSYVL